MTKILQVKITTDSDGHCWAAMPATDLSNAVALGLHSQFGGSYEFKSDAVIYYNGSADVRDDHSHSRALYQDLVDRVVG